MKKLTRVIEHPKPREGLWYWPFDDLLIECSNHNGMWRMVSDRGWADYLTEENPCSNCVYIGAIN